MVKYFVTGFAGVLVFCPMLASAYYEEALSQGGATEIEIVSQPSTAPQAETKGVEAKNLPDVSPLPNQKKEANNAFPGKPTLVSFIGTGKPILVSGKAKDLPLRLTVPMITPKGWRINFDPQVAERRVTFNANSRPWTLLLEEMANATNTMVFVDWRKAVVNVGSNAQTSQSAQTVQPTTQQRGGIVRKAVIDRAGTAREVAQRYKLDPTKFCAWNQVGTNAWLAEGYEVYLEEPPAGTIVVANIPASPDDPYMGNGKKYALPSASPVQHVSSQTAVAPTISAPQSVQDPTPVDNSAYFGLRPGPLSAQLGEWCARAGYELVWKVADEYEITSFSAFGSDFQKALVALFKGLMESGEPLRATVYERNHIVEVVSE